MEKEKNIHPLPLALEILRARRGKHPNYSVRARISHAEIQDETAVADLLSAIYELGYEIIKPSR